MPRPPHARWGPARAGGAAAPRKLIAYHVHEAIDGDFTLALKLLFERFFVFGPCGGRTGVEFSDLT